MKERLKLVESFSELRAGMIVVLRACNSCRRDHRGILTGLTSATGWWVDDSVRTVKQAWRMEPRMCVGAVSVVAGYAVDEGRVFKVDDGLEDFDTRESKTSKPKTLTRTR